MYRAPNRSHTIWVATRRGSLPEGAGLSPRSRRARRGGGSLADGAGSSPHRFAKRFQNPDIGVPGRSVAVRPGGREHDARSAKLERAVRALFLWILPPILLATLAVSASTPEAGAAQPTQTAVLVLVDSLTCEDVQKETGLHESFRDGAAATLSVVQGTEPPDDPRFGYVFLGAGSRVDTRFLPEQLPTDQDRIPDAFDGPASTVHPGSLGGALEEAGVQAAAVGDKARLVVMTPDGE